MYAYYGLSGKLALYKLAQNSPTSVYMAAISITSKYIRQRARNNGGLRQYFSDLGYMPLGVADEGGDNVYGVYVVR